MHFDVYPKAYIPLPREPTSLRPRLCVAYTNMLVFRNPCRPNATPNLPDVTLNLPNTTPNLPNVSRWNIGHFGSPCAGSHVGHVDFMLFVSISFALGSQCERGFWWNMGLTDWGSEITIFLTCCIILIRCRR